MLIMNKTFMYGKTFNVGVSSWLPGDSANEIIKLADDSLNKIRRQHHNAVAGPYIFV